MTFRAKPAAKRSHRPLLETTSRRTLYLNLFFGLIVVLGVLILGGAAVATYWNDHFASLATVNGSAVTRDDFRQHFAVESFRIDYLERQIRTDQAAGRISEAAANGQLQALDQRRQGLGNVAIENLIDMTLINQLATREGISVTEDQVTEEMRKQATLVERRHGWVITSRPESATVDADPTDEEKAAARRDAEAMLARIRGGAAFEDVAKEGSDDASKSTGGDLGFLNSNATLYDAKLLEAMFALESGQVSEVVEGEDGVFYITRVTEVVPQAEDAFYEQQVRDADVSIDAFRRALRADVARTAIEAKLVAEVVGVVTPQRRVSEIYLASDPNSPTQGDEVNVRHILQSPNDDPNGAQALPPDDPAWAAAEAEARANYETVVADPTKFEELAETISDDVNTRSVGGDLGYVDRPSLDSAFGDAIFADGLQKDQILEPVKTSFGWHVIQFIDRREPPQDRIRGLELELAAGKDFAELAREHSEADSAEAGGDAGWIAKYQLDSIRESAIFAAQVGGLTPVITLAQGVYLYKITAEEMRLPEPEQAKEIKTNAFGNWYSARKLESTITREYQSGQSDLPAE